MKYFPQRSFRLRERFSHRTTFRVISCDLYPQLSHSEKKHFQVELQILATISPSSCVWVLGKWPGTYFQEYMGQSKRYFKDTDSKRYLVPTVVLKDPDFAGLCMDAWTLSKLDPYFFFQRIGSDPNILRDPNRMDAMVQKAREQAASGKGLLVGDASNRDASPEGAVQPLPPSAVFGGEADRPPNSDSGGSAIGPANGQPPSVGGPTVQPRRESCPFFSHSLLDQQGFFTKQLNVRSSPRRIRLFTRVANRGKMNM